MGITLNMGTRGGVNAGRRRMSISRVRRINTLVARMTGINPMISVVLPIVGAPFRPALGRLKTWL